MLTIRSTNFIGALVENHIDIACRLIEEGVDINILIEGMRPLHYAVDSSNLSAVQLLLQHGADMSLKDLFGRTPLHYASFLRTENSYDIYKLLLENGANCNDKDCLDGASPFLCAIGTGDLRIVQLLLIHGADVAAMDSRYGNTVLHYAAKNQNTDVIEFILDQGFPIESSSEEDYSALHHAARSGNFKACEILLRRGAMVNRRSSKTNETPLSLAVKPDFRSIEKPRIVQTLLEHGANVADKVGGRSILEIAEMGSESIRNLLMSHIAKMKYLNVNINDYDQRTIEGNAYYRSYYQMCLLEFEKMTIDEVLQRCLRL